MPTFIYGKMMLQASEIRFTQDSILDRFQNNESCNDAVKKILDGRLKVEDFPQIAVAKRGEIYYSNDNRRLYVFRAVQFERGHCNVPVKWIHNLRPSSRIDGKEIKMRNGVALPHWSIDWDSNPQLETLNVPDSFGFSQPSRNAITGAHARPDQKADEGMGTGAAITLGMGIGALAIAGIGWLASSLSAADEEKKKTQHSKK